MLTRLLQSALITFAVYLTMLASSSPMQRSIFSSASSTERLELMNAQTQPISNQRLGKAVGTLSRSLERNARF